MMKRKKTENGIKTDPGDNFSLKSFMKQTEQSKCHFFLSTNKKARKQSTKC